MTAASSSGDAHNTRSTTFTVTESTSTTGTTGATSNTRPATSPSPPAPPVPLVQRRTPGSWTWQPGNTLSQIRPNQSKGSTTGTRETLGFRGGGSSSVAWCVVLVADGAGQPGDELKPAPWSRPRLAADRASVQVRLVKHDSFNMNGPHREPCATQSPNTR